MLLLSNVWMGEEEREGVMRFVLVNAADRW